MVKDKQLKTIIMIRKLTKGLYLTKSKNFKLRLAHNESLYVRGTYIQLGYYGFFLGWLDNDKHKIENN